MCVCPQTGQVHSYSFIHPLFRILFLLVYFLYGCLVGLLSLGYFALLPRPVLGCVLGTVSLGLSSATACSGCPFVSGVLLPLCFPRGSPFGVLRGSFLLLLLLGVSCLVALLVLALGVWGCCGLARSLLALPPPSPPPWLVLWRLLVQSVLCWSLPPGIWLYLQRSGCHTFGMACCG